MGGVVAYSNAAKAALLDVDSGMIEQHGAVSEEVVRQMAEGARKKFGTTYALATSGVAGPDGGTEEKPVGTIWIALAGPEGTQARKEQFGRSRGRNITVSTLTALNWLRLEILKKGLE
jgi:nicotinamide-nucleotide amidase